jgi:hypothetical protein
MIFVDTKTVALAAPITAGEAVASVSLRELADAVISWSGPPRRALTCSAHYDRIRARPAEPALADRQMAADAP